MSRLGARENLTVTLSAFKRSLASKEPPVGLSHGAGGTVVGRQR